MEFLKSFLHKKQTWVFLDQGLFSGTSFFINLVFAWKLEPLNFGIFASIMLVNYLLISGLNALVIQPLQVCIHQVKNQKTYISFSFFFQVLLLLFLGLLFLGINKADIFGTIFIEKYKLNLFLFIAVFTLHDYFRKLLLSIGKVQNSFLMNLLAYVPHISLLGYAYAQSVWDVPTSLDILSIGYVFSFIYCLFYLKPFHFHFEEWKEYLKMHIKEGKWLLSTAIVQWWSNNLFVTASGIFIGLEALGAFRLIQSLFGVLNLILQTFENYNLPLAAKYFQESPATAQIYLKKLSQKSLLFFGILLAILFFFAQPLLSVIGKEAYVSYAFIVQGMCILYLVIVTVYPIRLMIRVSYLNQHFFVGYLFSLLFGLGSFQFLLQEFQLIGAIIGLIASQLILATYLLFILNKKYVFSWKSFILF